MVSFTRRMRMLMALCVPALTVGPCVAARNSLDDYQHTQWTQENGAPPQIDKLAQTPDGWLWLSSEDGLVRFDGVSFEHYEPPGHPEYSHRRIRDTYAADNGDLYVVYFSDDIAILHPDGRFDTLPRPAGAGMGAAHAIAVDVDGSVWVAAFAIEHYAHGRWTSVAQGPEFGDGFNTDLLLDQDGRLWASNAGGAWRLDRARNRFERLAGQGGGLLQAPNGDVWTLKIGGAAVRVARSASGKPRPAHANARTMRRAGAFDAEGGLWTLDCGAPICLVRDAAARATGRMRPKREADGRLASESMLSGPIAHGILEDREGDIWTVTRNGLDRFRRKRFFGSGLGGDAGAYSLAATPGGAVFAADAGSGKLWRLEPGRNPVPLADSGVYMLATDRNGKLLMAGRRAIRRAADGKDDLIPLPPGRDGKPQDLHVFDMLDDGKVLWVGIMERGPFGRVGKQWLPSGAFRLPHQPIYLSGRGDPGQLWLAVAGGKLVMADGARLTEYDAGALGPITGIFPGDTPAFGGDNGFAILRDGTLQLLRSADPGVLRGISGLAVTRDGDRWLNGGAGVVHVRAADWQRALAHPGELLRYELFGAVDGYPGRARLDTRMPTAFSADGRHLWFLASGGIVGLDSADLRRNGVPPEPLILEVVTDAGHAAARPGLRLPPGAGRFRIQYRAPALRQPERLRFQYRLDGVDAHWQDGGARRSISYTNVPPGNYLFHVRAVNEDGVPSRHEAALRLTIEPTFVQAWPFKILCALAALGCATLAYRLRVRYLTRRLAERLTERLLGRLAERDRIARALHDTILQTVQALMLRMAALASTLPPGDAGRSRLEAMLGDAAGAIDEVRDKVHELRSNHTRSLEEAVRACGAELQALHPEVALDLRLDGASHALHAAIAEEIAQILCEGMRNAFAHAHARHIVVCIEHGWRTLTATVEDDGRGLDPEVARAGHRSGHWGLVGMRERARRIEARLEMTSGGQGGTSIALRVPASRAYASQD